MDNGQVRLTKRRIRSKILLRLKTQKEDDRERKSRLIKGKLFRTLLFKKAKIIMFYIAFDGEVKTEEMIKEAQNLGKKIAVPVCRTKCSKMTPCLLDFTAPLITGPYGVKEPAVKKSIKLEDLDLVIVPGVAFDKKNNRLGRGKGFYDRFLSSLPNSVPSIGLAYDFQILPSVPATKTDFGVNKVIFA
ncbi:MAG: 5-formyltetrahydrofolate cyclo-ligase [Candidatus Omnitrophica bacterium]|nr:5-formyltetrahydrofolate cyclo-ligase [Candidatus Omnitrophota bacterium]MDD5513312.1 5-formyltetrahydrofolate cyclo-ligase [Candidatus Omnitrophota bacterium]